MKMDLFRNSNNLNVPPIEEVDENDILTVENRREILDMVEYGVELNDRIISTGISEYKYSEQDLDYLRKLFQNPGIAGVTVERLQQQVQNLYDEYRAKLAITARYSLTAFHEYMKPGEFPAKHHIYIADYLEKLERGEIQNLMISMPPGSAKPLHPDTNVNTYYGYKKLKNIEIGEKVMTSDGTYTEVTGIVHAEKQEVWKIKLTDKTVIYASPDHYFPTLFFSKKTKDLNEKDYLYNVLQENWTRIESVENTYSIEDMLCLQVGHQTHTFVIDSGFLTHNSSYASRSFIQWCLGRRPWWQILAGGYGDRFTRTQFSKPNRDAIMSDTFHEVFPNVTVDPNSKAADGWSILDHGGEYYVRTPGSMTSGTRANLFSLDDILGSSEQAMSDVQRETVVNWMLNDVFPRAHPGRRLLLIGTRWHSDDPIGHLQKLLEEDESVLPGKTEIINISAYGDGNNPLVKKGHWLWEERYGAEHYESLRSNLSPEIWSVSYLGVPLDMQGYVITEEDFKTFNKVPPNCQYYVSIDTAEKPNSTSNRTAIMVLGLEPNTGKTYLVDGWMGKVTMLTVLEVMQVLNKKWNPKAMLIEDANMGAQIILNHSVDFNNKLVPMSIQKKGSKEFNMEAYLAPAIKEGRLLVNKNETFTEEVIQEVCSFPIGKYDDAVDALSQFFRYMSTSYTYGTKSVFS